MARTLKASTNSKLYYNTFTYSMVPLPLAQLAEIVSICPRDTSLDEDGIETDHLELMALCGTLVSVYTEDPV